MVQIWSHDQTSYKLRLIAHFKVQGQDSPYSLCTNPNPISVRHCGHSWCSTFCEFGHIHKIFPQILCYAAKQRSDNFVTTFTLFSLHPSKPHLRTTSWSLSAVDNSSEGGLVGGKKSISVRSRCTWTKKNTIRHSCWSAL